MNALVAYGSDSEESDGGHQHKQKKASHGEEDIQIYRKSQEMIEPLQPRGLLVEPRPPRRQSDLFEDDEEEDTLPRHGGRDGNGSETTGEEEDEEARAMAMDEEEEEELLRSGNSMAKFLMADHQANVTGASTPGGAGYTPRANRLEEGEVEEEMMVDEQQVHGLPVQLPPSPTGQCSPTLQRKFEHFFERKGKGWDPNTMIKNRRDFKNPSLYERLVGMFGIDEKGTNFPTSVFDPDAFLPSDFYDSLGDHQAILEAKRKRQQQQAEQPSIEKKPTQSQVEINQAGGERRSRFEGKGGKR